MNVESIKNFASSKFARQILITQKHSPKILFVAGTVGVVGATVLACRATLKMNDVLDEHEKKATELGQARVFTSDEKKDLDRAVVKVKIETGLRIAKLYALPVALGATSIAALTGSHVILTRRNGAVMAAYAALDKGYNEYRRRVAETYGKDVDAKFATGTEDRIVEEKTADGKVKKKVEPEITGRYGGSPYAVVFDERSKKFTKEPGMNQQIIMMTQNYANDKLRAKGHLFLNEVYDMLDLPRSKAGAVVGWVYRHDNEEKTGDNYVTFGVFEGDSEWVEAFMDGSEKYAVLDFNVDGVILDLI